MVKKKILYLTLNAGGGHKAAMTAIMQELEARYPKKYQQESVDLASIITPKLEDAIGKAYTDIVGRSKATYRAFFELSNRSKVASDFDKFVYPMLKKKIAKFFVNPPAVIVSTYPFMTYSFKRYMAEESLEIPFVTQLTDTGEVHSAWLSKDSDFIISPTEETSFWLKERGIEGGKIKTLGFPLRRDFRKTYHVAKTRKQLGANRAKHVLLYFNSGWSGGKTEKRIAALDKELTDVAIIVACAKNEKLVKALSGSDFKNTIIPLSYINNVPEVFNAVDLVVSKAGGASTAEIIGSKKPAVIMDVVPGQEEPNARFIEAMGFGYVEEGDRALAKRVKYIFESNDTARMSRNLKAYHGNDKSETDIAKFINSLS